MEEALHKGKARAGISKASLFLPSKQTRDSLPLAENEIFLPIFILSNQMEKPGCRGPRLVIACTVLLLGMVAFSCCVAAEFKKSEAARDLRLDGSLCSLPRNSAFTLGITALLCLSVAQIAGTSEAGVRLWSAGNSRRTRAATSIALLVLSWVSFGLAAILLGTASSMSNGQAYGRGWLDGDCYFVKDGVYIGSAVLAIATVIFILAFTFTATTTTIFPRRHTGPDEAKDMARQG